MYMFGLIHPGHHVWMQSLGRLDEVEAAAKKAFELDQSAQQAFMLGRRFSCVA